MQARRSAVIAILLLLASTARPVEAPHPSVSFLVSARNPLRNVSAGDLRRIFLGEISRWDNGHHIVLFVRPAETPEERLFLDRLVRMSDIDYSQWWLGAVFRGRAGQAPRIVETADAMARAVAANADAIGLVASSAALAESEVVVLTIDRRAPSDAGYPVRAR